MFIYGLFSSAEPGVIRYVGQTQGTIKARLHHHIRRAVFGDKGHKSDWIRKTLRDGYLIQSSFLALASSNQEADDLECYYIKTLREEGVNLTNHAEGGCGNRGWKHTEDWKQLRQTWDTSHPCTEETKRLLSEANKGKLHPLTEETKQRISLAQKGVSVPSRGRKGDVRGPRSDATRAKISDTVLSLDSPERSQKISDGLKLAYANGHIGSRGKPWSDKARNSRAVVVSRYRALTPLQKAQDSLKRLERKIAKLKDQMCADEIEKTG